MEVVATLTETNKETLHTRIDMEYQPIDYGRDSIFNTSDKHPAILLS